MEINKLKTFVDLAKTLSFSETAENLYTSQSTISKQVKSLEKELGQPLFIRTNKKVELSDFGKAIWNKATQIVELNGEIFDRAQKYSLQDKRQIRLGVIPSFSDQEIFQKIIDYQAHHAVGSISLHEVETYNLLKLLEEGKIDLAFMRSLDSNKLNYDKIPISQEDFVVCLNKKHPLAQNNIINLQDLKNESFILLTKKSQLYQPAIDLCHEAGFEPKISFISERMSSIFQMVKSNQGVAIVMHPLESKDPTIVFRKIVPTKTSDLLFIKNKGNGSKLIKNFWQYLQKFTMPKRNN